MHHFQDNQTIRRLSNEMRLLNGQKN